MQRKTKERILPHNVFLILRLTDDVKVEKGKFQKLNPFPIDQQRMNFALEKLTTSAKSFFCRMTGFKMPMLLTYSSTSQDVHVFSWYASSSSKTPPVAVYGSQDLLHLLHFLT